MFNYNSTKVVSKDIVEFIMHVRNFTESSKYLEHN